MNIPQDSTSSRKRAGFGRLKNHAPRIDMTPMVDLGFLLISFFVITTQLSKPMATDLIMPTDGKSSDLGMSYALTVMPVDENKIYYYHGDWETAKNTGAIYLTGYGGKNSLRSIIIAKRKALENSPTAREGKDGMMLLVKPSTGASYKNVVDVLDETLINSVKKKALLPLSEEEIAWLNDHKALFSNTSTTYLFLNPSRNVERIRSQSLLGWLR